MRAFRSGYSTDMQSDGQARLKRANASTRLDAVLSRGLALGVVLGLALFADAGAARPAPPPPNPAVAVSRHVAAATEHVNEARTVDEVGQAALTEARGCLDAARAAIAHGGFPEADHLAASADELVRAADSTASPQPPPREAAQVLANVDAIVATLMPPAQPRVGTLIALAERVAARARRDVALGNSDGVTGAARAEAIARAAAHVAIAHDPALENVLPRPGARPPPPDRP